MRAAPPRSDVAGPSAAESAHESAPAADAIRRSVYRYWLPVAALAAAAVWWLELRQGGLHAVDLYGLPTLALLSAGLASVAWRPRSRLELLEWTLVLALAAFLLASLAVSAAGYGEGLGSELTGLGYLLPVLFALSFLMVGPRSGVLFSASFYVIFAVLAGWGAWLERNDGLILTLLQMTAGNGLLLALLYAGSRMLAAQVRYQTRLEIDVATDPLTGAANRRAGEAALARAHQPLGLIVFDIDRFKGINDRYGHAVGDAVLRAVSVAVERELRPRDLLVRWGGEEFLVLVPGADPAAAAALAERLRGVVERSEPEPVGRVTASFGVAVQRAGEPWHAALGRADRASYRAKRGGRNRVEREATDPAVDEAAAD